MVVEEKLIASQGFLGFVSMLTRTTHVDCAVATEPVAFLPLKAGELPRLQNEFPSCIPDRAASRILYPLHFRHLGHGYGWFLDSITAIDKSPYMSLDFISHKLDTKRISARRLAERVAGGGFVEDRRAEILTIQGPPRRIR